MTFTRNWLEQSEAAKAEGVCHTESECQQMYSEIPQDKRDAAIDAFRKSHFTAAFPDIRKAIADDPEHWNAPYHFLWGMSVRNFFRQHGFGEDYFAVDNLDCCYKYFVEDAVKE